MNQERWNTKEEQVQSLRRAVDDIESERAVGVMVVVHRDDDEFATVSVASANLSPDETIGVLMHAARMVRDQINDPEMH